MGGFATRFDQRKRGALTAGRESVFGIPGEVRVVPTLDWKLRRALMQDLTHQRRRWRDSPPQMPPLRIDEVDGERGADTAQQHRAIAARMRGEHGEEAVDTELVRLRVCDAES